MLIFTSCMSEMISNLCLVSCYRCLQAGMRAHRGKQAERRRGVPANVQLCHAHHNRRKKTSTAENLDLYGPFHGRMVECYKHCMYTNVHHRASNPVQLPSSYDEQRRDNGGALVLPSYAACQGSAVRVQHRRGRDHTPTRQLSTPCIKRAQRLDSRCVLLSDPSTSWVLEAKHVSNPA